MTDNLAGPAASYLSQDGGAHWQALPAAAEDNGIARLFTHDGVSYTTMGGDLYVSRDQLQTWSQIDPPAIVHTHSPLPERVFGVWVQPVSGRILVVLFYTTETNATVMEFWTSSDQGAHWTRLGFPSGVPDTTPIIFGPLVGFGQPSGIVVTPLGGDSFAICTLVGWSKTLTTIQVTITCSQDGGHSWTQRPLPPGYDTPTNHFLVALLGVDQQGAVTLAGANNLPNDNVLMGDPTPIGTAMYLLLLPAGATQASDWQDLGETQDVSPTFLYGATSNGTVVWELPYTASKTVYTTTVP